MCLALPAKIISVDNDADIGVVSLDGVRKEISLALVENVEPGDYVLIHVGYALNKVSPEEAAQTLALMEEAGLVAGTTEAAE